MRNPLIRRGALALAVTMFAGGVALPATSVRAAEPDAPGVVATDAVQAQALAYLGVGIVELTKPLAQQLDLSRSNGVVVLKLAKDGPAQKAGVQVKDIITRLADTEIKKTGEVHSFLAGKKAGDKIAVTILRQGQPNPFKIEVTLGSYPMTTMPVETKPVVTKPEPSRIAASVADTLFAKIKELKGIDPSKRFDHMIRADFVLADKEGKTVHVRATLGHVGSIAKDRITLHLNGDDDGHRAFLVTPDTKLDGKGADLTKLKAGDHVAVITEQGSPAARFILLLN